MKITLIQTEKAYLAQTKNTYVFLTDTSATKQEIERAVKEIFKVNPKSIRTLVRNGKATRFSRGKRAYPGTTYKSDKKIVYVTLKDGESIKLEQEDKGAVSKPETKAKETK